MTSPVAPSEPGGSVPPDPDRLYRVVAESFGDAIMRLVRAYERDPDRQRDLRQEVHLALWRSFSHYESRCSLRTWVYRVAHNAAASYVLRQKRFRREALVGMDELETVAGGVESTSDDRLVLDRLFDLIYCLRPPDRQVMLLYLEDLDAATIGEITGLSAANVRTKIHRTKNVLARRFHAGDGKDHE